MPTKAKATIETSAPSETKKVTRKKTAKGETKTTNTYLAAVGRRKTAVAQVRLYPGEKAAEATINAKPALQYFGTQALVTMALSPLKATGLEEVFSVTVVVRGGGLHGQADAVKLGVARALVKHDELLRASLRASGMLTRDARAVERKKPGLKKARRAPQWSKR